MMAGVTGAASPQPIGVPGPRLFMGIVGLPALMFFGCIGFMLSVKSRLPEPLATHWNGSGQTNGTMSATEFIAFITVLMVVLWSIGAAGVIAGRAVRVRFRTERAGMIWCCGVTAFLSSVVIFTILANLDQPTAASAKLPPIVIVVALALAAIGALIGWFLAGPAPERPAPLTVDEASTIPPMHLAAGEHPVWHGHLTSKLMASMTALTLVIGLVLLPLSILAGVCVLVAVPVLAVLCSIDVVADHTGLTIRFGPFGYPRKRVPLDRIAGISAEDIVPLEWGGWGYRVLPGRSAVVMRSGLALVLQLTDGKQFAVTIDDALGAAQVLDAYSRRAATQSQVRDCES